MKIKYIPLQSKLSLNMGLVKDIERLPFPLALVYSIQYEKLAKKIKSILKNKTNFFSQVLGCSSPNFPKNTKAVLLVGESRFHALGLATEKQIPVFIFDNYSISEISEKEIKEIQKKKIGILSNFLKAERVGVLISTKPGQARFKRALDLQKNYPKKTFYFFISNELNTEELENYPGITSWINTGCPRIDMDINIINLRDLPKL